MNKCVCCGSEFTPVRQYGAPQLYCSKKCANKVRTERAKQRLIDKALQNETKEKELPAGSVAGSQSRSINEKEVPSYSLYRGAAGGTYSGGGVVPPAFMEHLERLYEQRFQEQVAAFHFKHQLEAMQKNNELLAAKLQEWEEEGDDEGGGGGVVAGIERLLENDRFMGLMQLGIAAIQGKGGPAGQ